MIPHCQIAKPWVQLMARMDNSMSRIAVLHIGRVSPAAPMWFKRAMRFAVLILALAAVAGCTAREAVLAPPAPVAEPIDAAIVPLTLEQDRQISSTR
jgi:predicted small lipoprotein YifL